MEKPQYGIFLKVSSERGFNRRESAISFGKGNRLTEIIEKSKVYPYNDQELVPIVLKAHVEGRRFSTVQLQTVGGLKELDVPREQVVIIDRRKTLEDRRNAARNNGYHPGRRKSLREMVLQMPQGDYLEVMHDDEREKKLPTVYFGRKGMYTEKVYVDDLFRTDRKYGFLRVDLKSEIGEDKDANIDVELRVTTKGRVTYPIPARYIRKI